MKYVLSNMKGKEGGYVVQYGVQLLSEFGFGHGSQDPPILNPLAATYPVLFPYGIGGVESHWD